jgi:hypothetical protein
MSAAVLIVNVLLSAFVFAAVVGFLAFSITPARGLGSRLTSSPTTRRPQAFARVARS